MSQLAPLSDDDRLIAMWLHGRPASTAAEYARDVAKFRAIVAKPLKSTTLEDLQHFQTTLLNRNLKPATLRRKINTIKSLYSFAASLNYLPFNIAAALRLPKAKPISAQRFLKPDEVKLLVRSASSGVPRILILFLYGTGVRVSEACTLHWRDCWVRSDGTAQATIAGKGDKQRVVLIPPPVWDAVKTLEPQPPQPDALVFGLDRRRAWAVVKDAANAAQLPKVSPHWFRHAHAIHSLKGGAPLELVRDSLGHSSIAVTNVYLEAAPDDGSSRYLDL